MIAQRNVRSEIVVDFWVFGMIGINSVFDFISVVLNQALDRPSGSISQSTDSVTLNLFCEFPKSINFSVVSISSFQSFHDVSKPGSSFSARSTLSTTFMLIELGEPKNGLNNISLIIHNNNRRSPKPTFQLPQIIKIHKHILTQPLRQ